MRFEFATATRIIFGPGTLKEVGPLAKELGSRALVVTGKSTDRAQALLAQLKERQVQAVIYPIAGEPTIEAVQSGVERGREFGCDVVIGFGGGSAIDAGKAIAALLTNPGEPLDYLEVIGRGQPIACAPLPCIAIPTTAGTGAEVTRNAVLASPTHKVKASLRSPLLLPRLAIVDSELTWHLPRSITASTGMDALTQLIEPYVSHRANPMTDALCLEGLHRAARSLRAVCRENPPTCAPSEEMKSARADMSLASLHGGLALANAALGAVHGFAAPIGGMFHAPHGAVCAALLPHVMEINLRALCRRAPENRALHRYDEIARILTGRENAKANDGLSWMRDLCRELSIAPLRHCQITPGDIPSLVGKASAASSMKGNPIALTPDELEEILVRAL